MPDLHLFKALRWSYVWPDNEATYRRLALTLGFLYLTELFAYQGFSLLANQSDFAFLKGNDRVVLALHIGMLTGAIAWCVWLIARRGITYGDAFRWSAWCCFLTSLIAPILAGIVMLDGVEMPWQSFALARFCFGAAFSAGLGLTVVFIADQFPRYLRTRGATLACAMGFTGPLLAAVMYWILNAVFPENSSIINLGVGVLLSVVSLYELIRNKHHPAFNSSFFEQHPAANFKDGLKQVYQFAFKKGAITTIFWSCAFLGISISFFSDLLHLLPRMEVFKGKISPDYIFFWRYIGIGMGTIWAGWLSWRKQARRPVLMWWLSMQTFALIALFGVAYLYAEYSQNWWFEHYIQQWLLYFAIAFSGLANASWMVNLLQTCEQFGRTYRLIAVLLAINVYRFGSIGLIGFNIIQENWFNQVPIALLGLGLIYIGIGLVANRQLRNNFEGDGLDAQHDPNIRSLSGKIMRDNLLNIQSGLWNSEQESRFLAEVSRVMHEQFDQVLVENYYMSTLYFAHEHDIRLGTIGKCHVREATYPVRGVSEKDPHLFHQIGEKFIETGAMSSLAVWLENEPDIAGLIIWYGGGGQEIDHSRLEGDWRTFNLNSIHLPDGWACFHDKLLKGDYPLEARQQALTELLEQACFDEAAWGCFRGEAFQPNDTIARGLRANLLFQCLEARGRYAAGLLFVYYIKPLATQQADLRGVLFLKMADQLSGIHLLELREILTWVLLQRAAALLHYSNRRIEREERHANWQELNTLVIRLENTGHWFRALEKRAQKFGFNDLKTAEFHAHFQPALYTSRHLRNLNEYYAFLTKSGDGYTADALAADYAPLLQPEKINLKSALVHEVENLKMNPETFQFSDALPPEDRTEMIEKCLLRCLESIEKCFEKHTVWVLANPTGLRVVLHEIMKNAAAHAHRTVPRIWISTTLETDGSCYLHIYNNWSEQFERDPARQHRFLEAIRHGVANSGNNFGIRNVHRFIHSPYFSAAPWQFDCADPRDIDVKHTDIFLKIPAPAVQIEFM